MKITEAQKRFLDNASDGWAYSGYSGYVRRIAASLVAMGLGTISESDLGPIFVINEAGRRAREPVMQGEERKVTAGMIVWRSVRDAGFLNDLRGWDRRAFEDADGWTHHYPGLTPEEKQRWEDTATRIAAGLNVLAQLPTPDTSHA